MPKQITTKKDTPVLIKTAINNINDNNESKVTPAKIQVSPNKTLYRSNKKNLTIEDNDEAYEERIRPISMTRSKSRKSMSAVQSNKTPVPESWYCENCSKINKPYEYKCQGILN